jgi:hypothetical protein
MKFRTPCMNSPSIWSSSVAPCFRKRHSFPKIASEVLQPVGHTADTHSRPSTATKLSFSLPKSTKDISRGTQAILHATAAHKANLPISSILTAINHSLLGAKSSNHIQYTCWNGLLVIARQPITPDDHTTIQSAFTAATASHTAPRNPNDISSLKFDLVLRFTLQGEVTQDRLVTAIQTHSQWKDVEFIGLPFFVNPKGFNFGMVRVDIMDWDGTVGRGLLSTSVNFFG